MAFSIGPGEGGGTGSDLYGIPPADGPQYDRFKWGGRDQDMQNGVYVPGTSGADQDVQRYRDDAGQYGNQLAPGIDRTQSGQSRGGQRDAAGLMRDAAYGRAPSAAQIYGQGMIDNSIAGSMATAASARGGPMAQAAALGHAQTAAAQQRQAGTRDLAAMRAQEMSQARGDYYGAESGIRQQDIGTENYATDNEARQRAMNQADRQFYEQQAFNVRKQQQDSELAREKIGNEGWYMGRKATMEDEQNSWDKMKDVASGVGSFVGGIFSDVRAKEDIYPVAPTAQGIIRDNPYGADNIIRDNPYGAGPSPAMAPASPSPFGQAMGGVGAGFSAFGAPRGAYAPIKSDARTKYVVSDQRAKEAVATHAFSAGVRAGVAGAAEGARAPAQAPAPPMTADELRRRGYTRAADEMQASQAAAAQPAPAAVAQPTTAQMVGGALAPVILGPVGAAGYATGMMTSDERAKRVVDLDENVIDLDGRDEGDIDKPKFDQRAEPYRIEFKRDTPADQKRVKRAYEDAASKDADAIMAGYGASLAKGPSTEDAMARANRSMEGSTYAYKPDFTPPEQAPGEQNVGPMAQNMAADPVASTAVKVDPATGMYVLDQAKVTKLNSAGIASLQDQLDELRARLGHGRR